MPQDPPAPDPGDAGADRLSGLRIGRLLGVPVLLSPSWFVLAALVVLSYGPTLGPASAPARGYAAAAGFALLLLLSVLLHEAGHCVAARALGLRVRSITVTFLAGLTEVVDTPATPGRAATVSVAGPLVSAGLTVVGALAAALAEPGTTLRAVLALIAVTNAGLAVFNLLPGLPLDGGGVLRAGLWRLTGDRHRATVLAAQAGRGIALAVVPLLVLGAGRLLGSRVTVLGLASGVLVALFVYGGATAALRRAQVEGRLEQVTAGALARPALLVAGGLPLADALSRAHEHDLHAMVVVDDTGRPLGVVSETAVRAVPGARRPVVPVGDLARPLHGGLVLDPGLSGEALLDAVRRTPAAEYLVASRTPPYELRVLSTADLDRAAAGRPLPAVA